MSLLIALGLAGSLVQAAAAQPGATVSGRVLEDGSRTSIAGAQVMLIPSRSRPVAVPFVERPRTAITDRDGFYEFDELDAGRYRITVQKAGFTLLNGADIPELSVEAGERREDVNVTLQKGAVIVGRVLDEAGQPLVNARVMAMQKPPVPPGVTSTRRDTLMPAGAGETNDLGEFRLFSLPPGEHYVQAMPLSDFGGSSAASATTMLPTYFPSASEPRAAQPISVGAGQTSGDVEIRMISAAAFHVSGVVRDEAGRPVVNAMVTLMVDEPTGGLTFMMGRRHQSRTDPSGRFTIRSVTNGTYTLIAAAPLVISGPSDRGAGIAGGGGGGSVTSFGVSAGFVGGTVGGGVTTETSNGTTVQYRDDTATRVPITIDQANVSGLDVIVRPPSR